VQALLLRELTLGPASHARIRVGDVLAELGTGADFPIDWKAFAEVIGVQPYEADYRGAAVLDVGAHKGYFGAYALACDASFVVSYEPSSRNFAALGRTAAAQEQRWVVHNLAIGRARGKAVLHLDQTSWAHSLIESERRAGEERVEVITLDDALADLPPAPRTIVKIDAEGSEWDIVEATGQLDVDVLMVECHPATALRTEQELVELVAARGMRLVGVPAGVLRFEPA
jgi:FkbM family methyltransferase